LEENITDVETGIGLQCELGQEVLRNISHFIKHEELDMSDEEKFDCVGDYLPKVNRRSLWAVVRAVFYFLGEYPDLLSARVTCVASPVL
jgi:hypothetical protein